MKPRRPSEVKYSHKYQLSYTVAPAGGKADIGTWIFLGAYVVIALVAVKSGYFFGTIFLGTAACTLVLASFGSRWGGFSGGQILALLIASPILGSFGLLFMMSGNTNSGPGLTNDDRYQRLLNESAYSCQPEHYEQANCRAQKQGLDEAAKWYNEQRR